MNSLQLEYDRSLNLNSELTEQVETYEQAITVLEDRVQQLSQEYATIQQDKKYMEKSLESALKSSTVRESHTVRVLEDEVDCLRTQIAENEGRYQEMISNHSFHTAELMDSLNYSRIRIKDLEQDLLSMDAIRAEADDLVC